MMLSNFENNVCRVIRETDKPVSYRNLAKAVGCSRPTAVAAVKLLITLGVLILESKGGQDDRRNTANKYRVDVDRLNTLTASDVSDAKSSIKEESEDEFMDCTWCSFCGLDFGTHAALEIHMKPCCKLWMDLHAKYPWFWNWGLGHWPEWFEDHPGVLPTPSEWIAHCIVTSPERSLTELADDCCVSPEHVLSVVREFGIRRNGQTIRAVR
jgi:hypothetical protein